MANRAGFGVEHCLQMHSSYTPQLLTGESLVKAKERMTESRTREEFMDKACKHYRDVEHTLVHHNVPNRASILADLLKDIMLKLQK